jgi:transposase
MCGAPKSLQAKTEDFIRQRKEYEAEGRPFVAIDETAFGRNTRSPYGYAQKGSKLFVRKREPRITTTSVVACVSNTGWLKTMQFVGSVNTDRFLEFLQQVCFPQDAVVLMDNVSFHHAKKVKEYVSVNLPHIAILYTPPYSPWYNPIESCFSIVKRHFAKGRTTVEESMNMLSAQHCESFFRKSLHCVEPF